jgi:glycosyltransferase involved in cell wall biosynthesis
LGAERGPLIAGIDGRELQGRPTGTGRYLRSLLRHWRETGDRFVVYFNGPPPAEPLLAHPRVVARPLGDVPVRGLVWQERRLPAAARADGLDVFFSPAYSCPLSLDLPRVTAIHDLSFFSLPQDFALLDGMRRRLLVSRSIAASRFVLACSDFTRREIARHFPASADQVVTVPLGADDDLSPAPPRAAARERLDLNGPLVLTVGAILNRRRLPELLRALAGVRRVLPSVVLDVVGENRTHPQLDFDALARRLGLDGHVRFSGFVDEAGLADRYAAADAAIFLSDYEGFGLPAVESAVRGLPVVASREPSLGEVLGDAALLVDPRDERAIADALVRVLVDDSLRSDLRERGLALASRYSWATAAARTRDVLHRAAGR